MSDTVPAPSESELSPDDLALDREVAIHQIGQWALVWRRFRRHRLAMVGGYIALLMLAVALLGPLLAKPLLTPGPSGETPISVWAYRNTGPQLWPPGQYIMGADAVGNPVLSYVLLGGRAVLAISVLGALLASLLGVLIGSLAGYLGRAVDAVLMRLVDAMLAIPFLLLLILLTRYLTDRGTISYILLFGIAGWPGVARLVRSYVLALRRREYAEAARALGVSIPGIIVRHILPNALDVIIVSFTLNVGVYLVTEVTMEYLGAGTGDITWGTLLPAAFGGILNAYWWLGVFPGLAILLTVLAVNFLGDGLRDALDATSRTASFSAYSAPRPIRAPGRIRRLLPFRLPAVRRTPPERSRGSGAQGVPAGADGHAGPPLRRFRRGDGEGVREHSGALSAARRGPAETGHTTRTAPATAISRGLAWLATAFPGRLRAAETVRRPATPHSGPLLLRVGPIALAFVAIGIAFLAGHSPLAYAPHYGRLTTFGTTYSESEYAAEPQRAGGWSLFQVDGSGTLVYERVNGSGAAISREPVAGGDSTTRPSMASAGTRVLGAWVADSGQTISAADLQAAGGVSRPAALHPIRLVPAGGIAEHPAVVRVPHGFDVLFDWQPAGRKNFDLERASFIDGTTRPTVTRLVASGDYALYPRGVVDGSGALDVLYLRRTSLGIWHVYFQRFSPAGVPLGAATSLARIDYLLVGPNGCNVPDVTPAQWAIDLKAGPDGSVWAAWEDGNDCVTTRGISGSNALYVGHWSRDGRPILPPVAVDQAVDAGSQAVALALQGGGVELYYERQGTVQPYLIGVGVAGTGTVAPAERVSYDGGGTPANPRAGTIGGRPRVIWEKVRGDGTTLQGASYRPYTAPDLLTRLGLNIGSLPGNLLLVIVGPLGGALLLTAINIFLLLPLVLVWLVVRRSVSGRVRRAVVLVAIALLLGWVFGMHPSPPGYVLVISGLSGAARLDPLYRWLAVGGAVFVAGWADRFLLNRQENSLRAAASALVAVYFIAAMYLLLFIQVEISRI